jgi:hypothetical protein
MKNKIKKTSLTLLIVAIMSAGIFYSRNSSPPTKLVVKTQKAEPLTSLEEVKVEGKRDELKERSIKPNKTTETARKVPETIHELASLYSKEELELMSETSKLKLDPKLVDQFIEKSKKLKSNIELIELAKVIGKNNLSLQFQFIKYANTKYPQPKVQKRPPQGELVKADHLFKQLKKSQ